MAGRDRHLHASGLRSGLREIKPEPFDPDWKGGFYCPCHKSRYDLAGRVFQGVPAPKNLPVPPYHFIDDSTIQIGVDPKEAG
jgi:ubiquinol-cytochrome c reductase iron-sulfur subunit